jgi:uncharacterized protein YbbK (DUF523 family)
LIGKRGYCAQMRRILVSGCLGGRPIRFDGTAVEVASAIWDRWVAQGRLVHVCPELAVGFPVPRLPAEIVGGTATAVLRGNAQVREVAGNDVTELFREAAREAVARAQAADVALAVLVDGSPTCGSTYVHDGLFAGGTVPGRGLAAELLVRSGVPVFNQTQLEAADALLAQIEAAGDAPR